MSSANYGELASPDRAAAERWCDRLWDARSGWAIAGFGVDAYLTNSGRYRFRYFRQLPFWWPSERSRLLDLLLSAATGADVYVAPLLRDAPSRRQAISRPLVGRFAWLDADDWDDQRHRELRICSAQLWTVASGGSPTSQHLYVDLEELLPGSQVARYSKRLARAFRTDTHGGDNKLLRLPGTLNHKPRLVGGQPGLVRWLP